MSAPVAESESAAASTRGPWTPGLMPKGGLEATARANAAIATDEPDSVPQDGIARAGGFRQRGKEEEIRGRTERWKNKWAAGYKRQQGEQCDGDEAVDADINRPHQAGRKVPQEPFHAHVREQRSDMLEAVEPGDGIVMFFHEDHQMFGSRSKYSSSSFLPPSPRPTDFSDSMNSIRSIHLTIL